MRSAAKYIWIFVAATFVGGFVLYETTGLAGQGPITATTEVAAINCAVRTWFCDARVSYQQYLAADQRLAQQQEEQLHRGLTLDERAQVGDRAFEQLVGDLILQQEYDRRGIRVTDEEILEASKYAPPPSLLRSPELQTDGRFDIEKYRRMLNSPAAKQGGLLRNLENYYREEIPRQKLMLQVAGDVWVSDAHLWTTYQDTHDTAVVTWVGWDPAAIPDKAVTITDAEIDAYYQANVKSFDRPGRAAVSVVRIARSLNAADSAAVRTRVTELRAELLSGKRTFEDAARELSADSGSAAQGGDLGMAGKGKYVKEFEEAARKLKPGELSGPVATQFGVHLIRMDRRSGDSLALHHILLPYKQSDSSASRSDKRADSLATIAASLDKPQRFDSAAKVLGLKVEHLVAFEGEPLTGSDGKYVPSVSAWAFGGPRVGETSDLYDSEEAYVLARLDSLRKGGPQEKAAVAEEIRRRLAIDKKLAMLADSAKALAQAARATSLEAAAKARGLTATTTPPFTRVANVQGLGQATGAIGAAFALPVGAISAPVTTRDRVIVMRVDRRVAADRAIWVTQKPQQRQQVLNALREQRVREYMDNLRKAAGVSDRRKAILEATRKQSS
ncbi:MAG: peptidylprolyl isomerase [Gemmatimonadetes bacterium]|nr:peptidylprolyl isomerase [Gemmatimonadota bacterium]